MPVLNEQAELVGIVSLDDMLMHMGHTLSTAADLVEEEVAAVPGDAWPRCGR
jgi:CBS-domain-containing membrane protein